MNGIIFIAIIIQSAIARSSRAAGAIAGYVITTGILLWGLNAYSDGNYISLFGIELSQGMFFLSCLIWYGIDTYQYMQAKEEDAAAREDFAARYKTKELVRTQEQASGKPAIITRSNLTAEEIKVLKLLQSGRNNLEIAEELGISPVHASLIQSQLREKYGTETNDELIKLTLQQG